jgi:hypothetical protein
MDVDKVYKLINPLSDNKRNEIIIRLPPYSHRDSYIERSRNVGLTKAPPINENRYKGV